MKPFHVLASAICLAALLAAPGARAFSEDDNSLNSPASNARFSDPDDQTPQGLMMAPQASYGQQGAAGDENASSYSPSAASFSDTAPASGDIALHNRH